MSEIDWTKPIETVPCRRNPVAVPCTYNAKYETAIILGKWIDSDRNDESGVDYMVYPDGRFVSLDGRVRNVVEQTCSKTLRDEFAMAALPGILTGNLGGFENERVATIAYKIADAMMAEREKPGS